MKHQAVKRFLFQFGHNFCFSISKCQVCNGSKYPINEVDSGDDYNNFYQIGGLYRRVCQFVKKSLVKNRNCQLNKLGYGERGDANPKKPPMRKNSLPKMREYCFCGNCSFFFHISRIAPKFQNRKYKKCGNFL